jgi:hypothetical protein
MLVIGESDSIVKDVTAGRMLGTTLVVKCRARHHARIPQRGTWLVAVAGSNMHCYGFRPFPPQLIARWIPIAEVAAYFDIVIREFADLLNKS